MVILNIVIFHKDNKVSAVYISYRETPLEYFWDLIVYLADVALLKAAEWEPEALTGPY